MFHILLVEDDANTRKYVTALLKNNGFIAHPACNGEEALTLMDRQHIDLMIADVMMPRLDGYELTQQLREAGYTLPILMVTAKQLPQDKQQGFLVGIDDYLTKPFDEMELILRIKALLRRAQIVNSHRMVVGDVILNYDALTVSHNGETLTLPPKEFYLLYKLLSYPDKIFTRLQLMDEIWGMDVDSANNTVNVHINRLRTRFSDFPEFEIVTVRGLGYKAVKRVE